MEVDITVKDLKQLPDLVGNFIRDKVVDYLRTKIGEGVQDIEHVRQSMSLILSCD